MLNEEHNKVALFIPDDLSSSETKELFESIRKMLDNTVFHCSFYRTIEEDFLEFLLTLPEKYYEHFTLHFISSFDYHDDRVAEAVKFLMDNGVRCTQHHLPVGFEQISTRHTYHQFIRSIIQESNEILSFFRRDNHQSTKLLQPVDLAAKYNKKSYINYLDGKGLVPVNHP